MKPALAVVGLLALVPVTAFAESDYSACMRLQHLTGAANNAYFPMPAGRSFYYGSGLSDGGYGGYSISYYGSTYGAYGVSYGGGSYMYSTPNWGFRGMASNSWSFGENTRVLSMSRACRHLIKMKPPAYRVVGMKSPAHRTSSNVTGRKATPQASPALLPLGN